MIDSLQQQRAAAFSCRCQRWPVAEMVSGRCAKRCKAVGCCEQFSSGFASASKSHLGNREKDRTHQVNKLLLNTHQNCLTLVIYMVLYHILVNMSYVGGSYFQDLPSNWPWPFNSSTPKRRRRLTWTEVKSPRTSPRSFTKECPSCHKQMLLHSLQYHQPRRAPGTQVEKKWKKCRGKKGHAALFFVWKPTSKNFGTTDRGQSK